MEGKIHKILLVDDEPFILKMYQTKLERCGYAVITAENGKEALRVAESEHPDIVLLDIVMNGMDGFAALKKMKKDDKLKRIPVFMLTNISSEKDKAEAFELGAAGYYIKTHTDPSELANIVEHIGH